eukprot:3814373-Pleurochrysis_carterae.AAC.1
MPELTPPEDEGVCSLWVGGLTPSITQQDIKDAFYSFGEILEIKLMSERRCALVTFSLRRSAEEAAKSLYRKLSIKGTALKLWWAKSQLSKDNEEASAYLSGAAAATASAAAMPPPPPGSAGGRMLYPSMNPNQMGATVRE